MGNTMSLHGKDVISGSYRISEEMEKSFRMMYGRDWVKIPELVKRVEEQKELENEAIRKQLRT